MLLICYTCYMTYQSA